MDRGGYDTFEILREELDTRLRDLLQAGHLRNYYNSASIIVLLTLLYTSVQLYCNSPTGKGGWHRRRIYTKEKAKVIAAIRGTEFIQFLTALAILHQDDMKKRITVIAPGGCEEKNELILHIVLVQNS